MNQVRIVAFVALFTLGAITAVHAAAADASPENLSEIKTKMNAAQSTDPE